MPEVAIRLVIYVYVNIFSLHFHAQIHVETQNRLFLRLYFHIFMMRQHAQGT